MCPATTQDPKGYCEAHAHLAVGWNKPGRATAEQRGYDAEWRRIRAVILKRDRYLCQCEDCKGMRLTATEVDHIVPKSRGGTNEYSNLRAINCDCHAAKTRREAQDARGRNFGQLRRT